MNADPTVITLPEEIPSSKLKLAELQALLNDPSTGRLLVSTYCNSPMEWVIPDLSQILGPKVP